MSAQTAVAPAAGLGLAGPIGSFDAYLERVSRIPVLSREREQELAQRFRRHDDLAAARELVLSHLRFVVHIARGYSGYGLPMNDLVQEGNIGLMKAVKRFDPSVGVRLVSFAVHWIRAEIHEHVLRNWRLVSPAEVTEMERRLSARDLSFDNSSDSEDEESYGPAAYLPAPDADPAEQAEREEWSATSSEQLSAALKRLDDRSRTILQRRWMTEDKATLHELADEYGVSAERIRQIEAGAISRLKALLPAPA